MTQNNDPDVAATHLPTRTVESFEEAFPFDGSIELASHTNDQLILDVSPTKRRA
jgi:hypothetical protein